jgi:hypothetical protein
MEMIAHLEFVSVFKDGILQVQAMYLQCAEEP